MKKSVYITFENVLKEYLDLEDEESEQKFKDLM